MKNGWIISTGGEIEWKCVRYATGKGGFSAENSRRTSTDHGDRLNDQHGGRGEREREFDIRVGLEKLEF